MSDETAGKAVPNEHIQGFYAQVVAGGYLQSCHALRRYNHWIDVARVVSGMDSFSLRALLYFRRLCHLRVVEAVKSEHRLHVCSLSIFGTEAGRKS